MRPSTAAIFAALIAAAFLAGQATGPAGDTPTPAPDGETNVTCYLWSGNGTAAVMCPDKVYAPDSSIVNIAVIDCHEYEYAVDEPHPCYG
jgi:hypothetical protein